MTSLPRKNLALPTVILISICAIGVSAQTYTVLHNFGGPGDGTEPIAPVVFDAQGNLYGTTLTGGQNGGGTVFKLTPSGGNWTESVLYSFTDQSQAQFAPVALDVRGNLYGEIQGGGSQNYGSVYELSPNGGGSWTLQTVHTFTGYPDGSAPSGGLVVGNANQIYGVANSGGHRNVGEVFNFDRLSATNWTELSLYSFLGSSQGQYPGGPLTVDAAGNLYGVSGGGTGNNGMIFKLTPNHRSFGWTESQLYSFQNPAGTPNGGLIFDAAGNIYGTGNEDGKFSRGTVYELSPNQDGTWTYTVLYNFTDENGDGGYPFAGLVMDAAGNLYGTTRQGGSTQGFYCYQAGCGTIFKLTPVGNGQWTESIVHAFDNDDGSAPEDGLVQDRAGNLYGTAGGGGTNNEGVVFEFTPAPAR